MSPVIDEGTTVIIREDSTRVVVRDGQRGPQGPQGFAGVPDQANNGKWLRTINGEYVWSATPTAADVGADPVGSATAAQAAAEAYAAAGDSAAVGAAEAYTDTKIGGLHMPAPLDANDGQPLIWDKTGGGYVLKQVDTPGIKDGAVTSAKLAPGAAIANTMGAAAPAPATAGQVVMVRSDGTIGAIDATPINVQAWGAKGDSVTNDTVPFQNAQARCRATNRPLYAPGTPLAYLLTQLFALQQGERWTGDHWGAGHPKGTRLQFSLAPDASGKPGAGACFTSDDPLNFNDGVTFEDIGLVGDSTNTQVGFFMPSCRYWKFRRVWMTGITRVGWYTYGQRNTVGLIDGTHPGDCTHNEWDACDAIMANFAGARAWRLGGTCETDINGNPMVATTITADGGATITVADGSLILGSAGTIYCQDNGEYINFSGKSSSEVGVPAVLTVIRRAVNGSAQIVHPGGTGVAVWDAAGQTNMGTLKQCVGTNTVLYGGSDAFWMEHGTTNSFVHGTAGVGVGGNGFRVSAPGNNFQGGVSENNALWGIRFDQTYQCYGNLVRGWQNGGSNLLGFILDEGPVVGSFGTNSWDTAGTGLKFSSNYQGTGSIVNTALYGNTDGLLRWRDGQGLDRPAFGVHSWECPSTSLTAGTVTRFRALNLTATPFSVAATLDIWDVEACSSTGGIPTYSVDIYDETGGALLTTPTGLAGVASASGGSLADGNYYAYITAVNTYGETVQSAQVGPISVAGGGGAGSIAWSWTQVTSPGIIGYRLYIGTSATGEANYVFISGGATTTYTQTAAPSSLTSGKPPAIDRSGNIYSWVGAYKRGTPLVSLSGLASRRYSVRLSNPSASTATVTGHYTWSLRNI